MQLSLLTQLDLAISYKKKKKKELIHFSSWARSATPSYKETEILPKKLYNRAIYTFRFPGTEGRGAHTDL